MPLRFEDGDPLAERKFVVIAQAVVDATGLIRCARLLRAPESHRPLEPLVATALASWRFDPARLGSEPVAVFYNLTLHHQVAQ